ncbi:S-adenosylmethionine uptake transporter [Sphingomonas vulcanisoli]|uniref:S-adenosylmethionine uptake transporter n=1 Tax=Sphingomonas vulcanisoli TaxID=1658060 RepID=A0ABX0TLN6_9SPHN|nr:DMT family transporter [Sphingomonas vulcanisoli]NIJ06429.1 S-adenosylmethionine uptake transporter [Sphingomonas vulcanisoli]
MDRAISTPVAFAAACLGIAVYSAMDVTMKLLTLASGVYCALLWRSVVGTILSGGVYLARRPAWPTRAAMRLHIERGLIVTAMAMLFFWGLARVPMAQAIALCFIAPLLALGLAVVLLKERIGRDVLGASAIAFAGVLVVAVSTARSGQSEQALYGTLAVLCAALCYAYNIILMRRQGAHSDAIEVAFFQNGVMAAVLLCAAPWLGAWPLPSQWPIAIGGAMFATIANILLAWAYSQAPANRMAPSEYTGFLWASLFGWAFFHESVRAVTLGGAALIIAGCLIAARRTAAEPMEAAL